MDRMDAAKRIALPDTDGLITSEQGLVLSVLVADCVPVWLYDPVVGAAGLVHAGRVGTFHGVAGMTVAMLAVTFGCEARNIRALIGPSASPDAYEVSSELATEWVERGLPANGPLLDLWGANKQQLIYAGLTENHVLVSGICTIRDERFFSYRRDGTQARNMAICAL